MATDRLNPTASRTSLTAWITDSRWFGPALVACVSLVYYFVYRFHFINMVDEGLLVNGAMRLLDGQQPVTEFWAYPPGRYAALAGAFKLLGIHLTSERYLLITLLVGRNVLIYLVARHLLPFSAAIMIALTIVLVPGLWHKVFYSLPLFAHLLALLCYIDKPTVRRAVYCGIVSGITLYFRQDVAVYSLIAAGFAFVSVQLIGHGRGHTPEHPAGFRRGLMVSMGHLFITMLAAFIATVPLILYYVPTADYGLLLNNLGPDPIRVADVVYQTVHLTPIWRLPRLITGGAGGWMNYRFYDGWFPWVFFIGTGVAVLVGLLTVWHWWRDREPDYRQTVKSATLLVWSMLAISRLVNLPSAGTCLIAGQAMMIVFTVLLVALWAWTGQNNSGVASGSGLALPGWPTPARWLLTITYTTVFALSWFWLVSLTAVPVARVSAGSISCMAGADTTLTLQRAELVLPGDEAADLANIVEQIRMRTREGQPMIAYRQAMFYFLADRPNATSYDNIIPPVALPHVAKAMAEVVSQTNPPALHVVDLSESWTRRVLESYPSDLRSALFTGYQPTYQFGNYVLLEPSPGSNAWDLMKPLWIKSNKRNRPSDDQ